MMERVMYYRVIDSPVGELLLAGDGQSLKRLAFVRDGAPRAEAGWQLDARGALDKVCGELDRYFAGRLTAFRTAAVPEGTEFQRRVWRALCDIPYGQTVSYSHLARTIGAERAVRAVGAANGANPIAIIVPCHRVIGANGALTGFGGGLPVKRALLDLEQGTRRLL
jgi:methylated-DNA-[protein]-cysteine S-methyltransferase